MAGGGLHCESGGRGGELRGCVLCCSHGRVLQMAGSAPLGRLVVAREARRLTPPVSKARCVWLNTGRFDRVAVVKFAVSRGGEVVS